jgi:hypothetical protein
MFKPDFQISHNKQTYYVVLDHIIARDGMVNDESHFVSKKQQITSSSNANASSNANSNASLEISFINDYRAIDQTNPIGFWQTILSNHTFDYSSNFKYKFKIEDETYLISFDVSKGILIHVDTSLVDVDTFDDIEIDFDGFTHFEIIKTEQQKTQDKRHLYQRIILKHLMFYGVLLGGLFIYYQYQNSHFVQMNEQLLTLKAKSLDLHLDIDHVNNSTITTDTNIQQAHVRHLLHVLAGGINIQKSEIDLTQSLALIVIDLDNLDRLKHLAKANNMALISINRNFVKNTAAVSWQIRGKQ